MTVSLSDRMTRLKPSASIAAKAIVNDLRAQGRRIADFTIGEPDLDTPPVSSRPPPPRCGRATPITPRPTGTPALRAAIAAKYSRENGLTVDPANVVVGVGAKQLIFEAFAATLNDGDEVIVPAPYWVSYPDIVRLNGGVIVPFARADGFKLTGAALETAIPPPGRAGSSSARRRTRPGRSIPGPNWRRWRRCCGATRMSR